MDSEPTITLHCVRKNGSHERTKLSLRSVSEAREVAKRLLRLGNGLYSEVDICTEDGTIETIMNSGANENAPEVLLVEDNAGDALLVGQALADCPTKVHLHIARDGEQALQILGEPDYTPDLIILDLNIPKIEGHEVLRAMKADLAYSQETRVLAGRRQLYEEIVSSITAFRILCDGRILEWLHYRQELCKQDRHAGE